MSRALSLAGFQVTIIGRFWVTTEGWTYQHLMSVKGKSKALRVKIYSQKRTVSVCPGQGSRSATFARLLGIGHSMRKTPVLAKANQTNSVEISCFCDSGRRQNRDRRQARWLSIVDSWKKASLQLYGPMELQKHKAS
jgi:hypothetical protein